MSQYTGSGCSQDSNSSSQGVQSLTAGSNISITGTTNNPVINASAGSSTIPQYDSDPVPVVAGSLWVLRTVEAVGSPIGLLLSLTQSVEVDLFQLCYRTAQGTTVRTYLS